jgi:hypothetical protein
MKTGRELMQNLSHGLVIQIFPSPEYLPKKNQILTVWRIAINLNYPGIKIAFYCREFEQSRTEAAIRSHDLYMHAFLFLGTLYNVLILRLNI